MKRFLLTVIFVLFVLGACTPSGTLPPTQTASPQPMLSPIPFTTTSKPTETLTLIPPTFTPEPAPTLASITTLHRGINFGNMLEAPNEGDWGTFVQEEYFDLVKQAGFDFVRLPVKWSGHAENTFPYTIDSKFFSRIDQILDWGLQRHLTIILDFHHYDEIMSDPAGNKARFLGIWKQIAKRYKNYPANLVFELLNEPNSALDESLWNKYAVDALQIIRQTNPTRDVVIGPTQWNSYDSIPTLDLPNDPHLIVTFHYYEPFQFTNQGAEWLNGSNAWMGTTWDGTTEEKAAITGNFDSVSEWAKQHGNVRILIGEFGAYSKAPEDSRVRWTTFVREQAESHGFAWSYWEFNAGFGVYDPNEKAWHQDLLKALIP